MSYTLITGATGGIGKEFCFTLAKQGENLFLTGRSEEKLLTLKQSLLSVNNTIDIITYPLDLTDEVNRRKMFLFIDENNLKFSRLINVAGVDIQKGFLSYTDEKIVFQTRVNTESVFSITHGFLNRLSTDKSLPEIITISSISGVSPMPNFAIYSATKCCLTNFFKALRVELKGKVKITTVMPGGVYTRPDVVNDIKGQGLWGKLSAKNPDFIVKKSLKAVKRNKKVEIPGFWNKFLYFILKITPENLTLKIIRNRWSKQQKDAF
jgi:short-subunit dehydrogenase